MSAHITAPADNEGRASVPVPPSASASGRSGPAWRRLRPLIGPLTFVAMVAMFGLMYPTTFLTPTNLLTNILANVTFVAIVAAAQTLVMAVGDFDLSVGGVAALATSFTAAIITTTTLSGNAQEPGPVALAVTLGLAVGLLCGILNGLLVSYLGVLAFIATLGMAQVYTSLARYRVDGRPVYGLVEEGFVSPVARCSGCPTRSG
ncbi:MAG: hypothetical protein C4321_01995 [Chloroflexota bacterium]